MKWIQYVISILVSLGIGYVLLLGLLFIICILLSIVISVC